ncbi:hypothetical protein H4R18_001731 [Coemansia javaensis]|uniref:Uncharacterized protein n=1 Tax=Coemansia javaensis TaxID=2761396 RepID=A0A9W8HES9_9FUNG|nr:hypothetical protein H4R18_001731 [Coemansia javaensis]
MARRRYRRIEWADAMASHETLVEGAGAAPEPAADRASADTRPAEIRSSGAAVRLSATTRHEAAAAAVLQSAPAVTRSDSEQTAPAPHRPTTAMSKLRGGLIRRMKESMKRQIRGLGASLAQTHFYHDGIHSADGYYAVGV